MPTPDSRGRAGGLAVSHKPAPSDCEHCSRNGHTRWHQHIGHLGFAAYLRKTSRCSLRWKLKHTRGSRRRADYEYQRGGNYASDNAL